MPGPKAARVLRRHLIKLFLIPAISIRRISVVSVMLLCNRLLGKRFRVIPPRGGVPERYSQDTTVETLVRSKRLSDHAADTAATTACPFTRCVYRDFVLSPEN
jgi:hypothetical protein